MKLVIFISLLTVFTLTGCGAPYDNSFYSEEVFSHVSKEEVFDCALKVMKKNYSEYQIKREDVKEGVIETEWLEYLVPTAYLGKRTKIEIRINELPQQNAVVTKTPSTNTNNSQNTNQQIPKKVVVKVKATEETNKTFKETLESEKAKWENTTSDEPLQELILFRIRNKLNKFSPGNAYLEREKRLEEMLEKLYTSNDDE